MQSWMDSSASTSDMPAPKKSRINSEGLRHLLIVLIGIWLVQFALFGPSLLGRKILLPLDILALPGVYLPNSPGLPRIEPDDPIRSDLVLQFEPERRFIAGELASGRLPAWQPFQFGGVPTRVAVFSPLTILKCATVSPVVLAWVQFAVASIAGLGAYRFLRNVTDVGFWAAAIPAWCYPLSGAFVLWQGFPLPEVICWLPWLLVAEERAIRDLSSLNTFLLASASCLVLLTVSLDIAGLSLLVGGLFGLWRIAEIWLVPRSFRVARRAVLALIMGWSGGFLLAAPHLLPMLEYAGTGARMEARASGAEERPPIGMSALPQTVLPDFYGTTQIGSYYLAEGNMPESSASAYAGLLAALLFAPLAWSSRKHRSFNALCAMSIILGLAWAINCLGLVQLFRLPGLNMFSFNRFVFLSGFAILVQTAIGLEVLSQHGFKWTQWYWIPVAIAAGLAGWCCYRTFCPTEPISSVLTRIVDRGQSQRWIRTHDDVASVQNWFRWTYIKYFALCALTLLGWLYLRAKPERQRTLAQVGGILMVAELFFFAFDRSAQGDWALYYPDIPALRQVAEAEQGRVVGYPRAFSLLPSGSAGDRAGAGRVVGYGSLPANLAVMQELLDVRGYDAVDPKRYVELVRRASDPRAAVFRYTALQNFFPLLDWDDKKQIRLPAILDLLGVRYVVFRGVPPAESKPDFVSPDYYVMVNRKALPRAFVPEEVIVERDSTTRLQRLASPDFAPLAVAYVENETDLPGKCQGEASVTSSLPTRITLSLNMTTAGLVVLTDRWDKGWKAYLDDRPVPILCVDHALRGVVAPKGGATLEYRYEPTSLTLGLIACGSAIAILVLWGACSYCRRKRL